MSEFVFKVSFPPNFKPHGSFWAFVVVTSGTNWRHSLLGIGIEESEQSLHFILLYPTYIRKNLTDRLQSTNQQVHMRHTIMQLLVQPLFLSNKLVAVWLSLTLRAANRARKWWNNAHGISDSVTLIHGTLRDLLVQELIKMFTWCCCCILFWLRLQYAQPKMSEFLNSSLKILHATDEDFSCYWWIVCCLQNKSAHCHSLHALFGK